MPNGKKLTTYTQYALGMLAESGWILALTGLAFLLAVAAKAIWR